MGKIQIGTIVNCANEEEATAVIKIMAEDGKFYWFGAYQEVTEEYLNYFKVYLMITVRSGREIHGNRCVGTYGISGKEFISKYSSKSRRLLSAIKYIR